MTGLPSGAAEIKEGKLEGENLTFWIMTEYQGNPIKLVYRGKVKPTRSTSSSAPKTAVGARS